MIVYYSLTGNVLRFIRKTGITPAISLPTRWPAVEPFILVTPTTGFGEIPVPVVSYLTRNSSYLRGVAASGNRNWGANYGAAADKISAKYNVPTLLKFELSGTDEDVRKFTEEVALLAETH